mgnify:CR=1 FL=1
MPEVGESPKAGSASEAGDEVSSMQARPVGRCNWEMGGRAPGLANGVCGQVQGVRACAVPDPHPLIPTTTTTTTSSTQELRLRVLNGIKRHFRAQRMAGLLSPAGLRVAM